MSKQEDDFFVIFDDVYHEFGKRNLTDGDKLMVALDIIEKIAVHLNMNNSPRQSGAPAGGIPDGQEGTASGALESLSKRTVNTKNGERTAFDLAVAGQKYSTFDKKLFPLGMIEGDKKNVKFRQNGKFRNLVEITKDGEDSDIPF